MERVRDETRSAEQGEVYVVLEKGHPRQRLLPGVPDGAGRRDCAAAMFAAGIDGAAKETAPREGRLTRLLGAGTPSSHSLEKDTPHVNTYPVRHRS